MPSATQLLLIGFGILIVLMIGVAAYFLYASGVSSVVGLPMLSVGAVVLLLAVLCVMSVVYAYNNLEDRSQALALPEGSIRAVIALMLIVLFAILSIYLYGNMAEGQLLALGTVDDAMRSQIERLYPEGRVIAVPSGDSRFQVWVRQSTSPEAIDFAKQLLVLVGTLVTSIASFYFGSKTASAGEGRATDTRSAIVEDVNPKSYAKGSGPQTITVSGRDLGRVTAAKVKFGAVEIDATNVRAQDGKVDLDIDLPATAPSGVWSLILIDARLGEVRTPAAFFVS